MANFTQADNLYGLSDGMYMYFAETILTLQYFPSNICSNETFVIKLQAIHDAERKAMQLPGY